MTCFIIAEAGVNHNGSEKLALQLVEAAAKAGADSGKLQTFKAGNLVSPGADKADYQRRQTGKGDQFSMLQKLELPAAMYPTMYQRCLELGIEFMSTPFDSEAADMLIGIGMKRIKVPSGEITNHPFLEFLAAKDLPLIVSTGMATLEEVREAVEVIGRARKRAGLSTPLKSRLTLLHCTSNYPTEFQDVNLRAMQTLQQVFDVPVGYSDHTRGTVVPVAATAIGAVVIEKHFTLNRDLPGPDHLASIEPQEFSEMVAGIRVVEQSLGSGEKEPRPNE